MPGEFDDLIPEDVRAHVDEVKRISRADAESVNSGSIPPEAFRRDDKGESDAPMSSSVIAGGSSASSRLTLELQVTVNLGEDIALQIAQQIAGPLKDYFDRLGVDILYRVREQLDHIEDLVGSQSPEGI